MFFTFGWWVFYMIFLAILVVLMVFWFIMIARVMYKSVVGKEAKDERSDDEDEHQD